MASSTMNDPAGTNAAWMMRSVVHAARPARKLGRFLVRALLVLSMLTFVAVAVGPRFGLYRPLTVLSGSMRPTFNPGDLVIVRPEPLREVRVGQVISYQVPVGVHQVETHRIVRVVHGGAHPVLQTKGDANNVRDPWTAQLSGTTAWRLAVVIPYGGYVINALRSRELHFAALVVAPGLVALLLLANLWGVLPRRRRTGDVAA
jgi:signal peptidase